MEAEELPACAASAPFQHLEASLSCSICYALFDTPLLLKSCGHSCERQPPAVALDLLAPGVVPSSANLCRAPLQQHGGSLACQLPASTAALC